MKLKTNDIICVVSFYLMTFCVLFLVWANQMWLVRYVAVGTCAVLLIINYKKMKFTYKEIMAFAIYILYLVINYILTDAHSLWIKEVIGRGIIPLSIVLCFRFFMADKEKFEKLILNPSFIILNAYCVINTIITFIQIYVPGFLFSNPYGEEWNFDKICGLLGTNGTHRLCFFTLVCLMLNYIYLKDENKTRSKIAKIMFIFIIISSIYISAFNDNRMYYFLLMLFLIPMIFTALFSKSGNKIKIKRERIGQITCGFLAIVFIVFGVYTFNDSFKEFIDKDIIEQHITRTFDNVTDSLSDNSNGNGEERIELLKYSLENGNGYLFGKGIGAISLLEQTPYLPNHFTLNDMVPRIYTGGIIYLLILVNLFYSVIASFSKNLNKWHKLFIFVTLLIFTAYARIFTIYEETVLISMLFMFYTYAFTRENKSEIEEKK